MASYRRKLPRIEWGTDRKLFRYRSGDTGYVHTRADASTCASYMDANGVLQYAAANVLRDGHIIGGVRHTLVEPAATNLSVQSSALDHAAWTKNRASASANADLAPDGTLTADRLIEDSTAAASHRAFSTDTVTITADGNVAVSRWLKAGTRSWAVLGLTDSTETNAARAYFDLTTGVVGGNDLVGTGTVVRTHVEAWTNGWYRCTAVVNLGGGITQARHYLGLATGNGGASYSGDGASYLRTWGADTEIGSVSTSYIPTGATAVTRAADSLYFPFAALPQEMTVYVKGVERGTILRGPETRLLAITADPLATAAFRIDVNGSGFYRVRHSSTAGAGESGLVFVPTVGQPVELRATLASTGAVQIGQSLGGATETTGAVSGAAALNATWSGQRLHLGGIGAANVGAFAFQSVAIAAGTHSMARMRALAASSDATIFANALTCAYPFDEAMSYSPPAEGSEMVFLPNGEADAWDTGERHVLEGAIRWIPQEDTVTPVATGWDGTAGWRAFLSWARRGNPFWFCPDATDLSTGWTVYLQAPWDEKPDTEADMTRAVRLTLRGLAAFSGY
jgi:hypothetical protein